MARRYHIAVLPFLAGAALWGQGSLDPRGIIPASSTEPSRKALLIGNQKYSHGPLRNPANDARDLGESLGKFGFRTEILIDSGKKQIEDAVRAFAGSLAPGDIGVFYYSGHGFQIDSENYIVPVEFAASTANLARNQAVPFAGIKDALERSPASLVVMILDSCRDNPFAKTDRSNATGLAMLEAGLGSYIAFAASPGKTASDNASERNGLFAKYLLLELPKPVAISELFRRVRKDVFEASRGGQLPYLHDQMIADVAIGPAASAPVPQPPAAAGLKGGMEEGKRLYHLGRCQESAAIFDRVVRLDPDNALAQNALGLAYTCMGLNSPAAERFRMAIELKPDLAAAYLNRGQVYLRSAKFDLAIQDFTWAIEQDPQNGVSWWRRGWAKFGLRRYEDARQDFDRAIELDPSDPNGYHGRGKVLHQLGNFAEALKAYDQAIERRANVGAFYEDRAATRERLRDKSGAESDRAAAQRYRL